MTVMKTGVYTSNQRLNRKDSLLIFCIFVFSNALFAFEHPGGMHSKAQIEFIRHHISQKNEPYYPAFQQLMKLADTALIQEHHALNNFSVPGYYKKPVEHIKNSTSLETDAFNAYACALAWQLSGKKRYAKRALYFINAWSHVNKLYSDSDGPLVMSFTGSAMVMAAELMVDYRGWNVADKQLFIDWLNGVYRKATNEIRNRKNNWADWGRFGSSLSAYYLNDTLELKENIRLFKSDIFDKIADDGHMPEETKRGTNGIWYTYFSLAPMTAMTWVAHNATGENLFTLQKDGRSIKSALDYLLYYNQHPDEWKWFKNPVHGTQESKFSDLDLKTNYSFWPANLIEAMSGIYGDVNYVRYVAPYRPLCYEKHHFAWVFTTLMPPMPNGYK
jgi:hypothetical protein